jgi:hypothetical protein
MEQTKEAEQRKPKFELVTFLDSFQRTVIGQPINEKSNEMTLVVKNPVVVNVIPQVDQRTGQPTGQMALQLLPLFFREFLGAKEEPVYLSYGRALITPINFEGGFDWRLYGQYESIFLPPSRIITPNNVGEVTPAQSNSPVVNLFPEDKK